MPWSAMMRAASRASSWRVRHTSSCFGMALSCGQAVTRRRSEDGLLDVAARAGIVVDLVRAADRTSFRLVADAEFLEDETAVVRAHRAAGLRRDPHGDQAFRLLHASVRRAVECPFHEVDPDRQRRARTLLAGPQRLVLVEAHPGDGDQVGVEAAEPGVAAIVGGAGLAVQIVPAERAGAPPGTAADDVAHHDGHQEGILPGDRPVGETKTGV